MFTRIYRTLLKHYGRQHWWPVTPQGKLLPAYSGGPKTEKQQLEVIVGAILTQNTAWKNVEKAVWQLNSRDMIDLERLSTVPTKTLARLIRSSGYFNQKAKKLKTMAGFLKDHPISSLGKMRRTRLRELLLEVNGIGPETADSIMLYALNKPIFVIDAYTKRIFTRTGLAPADADYDALQKLFEDNLRKDRRVFNEYHALIVEHGKNVCRRKPLCDDCVIRQWCKKLI